jgi:hypothetical protein
LPSGKPGYTEVLTAAINDLVEHGYDSQDRLDRWVKLLSEAADGPAGSEEFLDDQLRRSLVATYDRLTAGDTLTRLHPGVSRFTIENIKPQLRAQLDRAIHASADLIRLNKAEAKRKTLQRFVGWSTSLPPGRAAVVSRAETKKEIKKSLTQLPFVERRVLIDQGHKLTASINRIVAVEGGAIAARWLSHVDQPGYDYRVAHAERQGKVYLIRGSWAQEKGLVKPGPAGYTDQITQPGEEVFCRCKYVYYYNLRQLPDDMLTVKGREALLMARAQVEEMV